MSPYRTPATMPVEPPLPTSRMGVLTPLQTLSAIASASALGGGVNVLVWGYSPLVFFDVGITFAGVLAWHWWDARRLAR